MIDTDIFHRFAQAVKAGLTTEDIVGFLMEGVDPEKLKWAVGSARVEEAMVELEKRI